jgi:hypothetical protein
MAIGITPFIQTENLFLRGALEPREKKIEKGLLLEILLVFP